MARFHGVVGYGETKEISPGVHEEEITERSYFGDILRSAANWRDGEHLHNDLSVSNSISIVADAYARDCFFAIRYVKWSGTYWTVTAAEVRHPRIILQLGEIYNGPKATTAGSA